MLSLSGLRNALRHADQLQLLLPDGSHVPYHFHITEAGLTTKHFIDCGGTIRKESVVSMQVWYSDDLHHRLTPGKLLKILDKAEPLLGGQDLPVEIEYQKDTIGKYNVRFDGKAFQLIPTETDCLAKENCGIPASSGSKIELQDSHTLAHCAPGSGCC